LLYGSMAATFFLYVIVRWNALGGFAPGQGVHVRLTAREYLPSVIVTAARYLWKLITPLNLNFYYQFEPTRTITAALIGSFAVIVIVIAAIFHLRPRSGKSSSSSSIFVFGLFLMMLTLAPALNLTGVGENVFAERYLYLPSVGFILAVAVVWQWCFRRQIRITWAVSLALLVAASVVVVARNRDWKDEVTLLRVTATQSPRFASVHDLLHVAYTLVGEREQALQEERLAVQLKPDSALFRRNLGAALVPFDARAAIEELEISLKLQPESAVSHYNLGTAWQRLRDFGMAAAEYEKALAIRPDFPDALMVLGGIYLNTGKTAQALGLVQRAAKLLPADPEPWIKLSVLYNDVGEYGKAAEAALKALGMSGTAGRAYAAHYNLGVAYTHLDSKEKAIAHFKLAAELRPDFQDAKNALNELQGTLN